MCYHDEESKSSDSKLQVEPSSGKSASARLTFILPKMADVGSATRLGVGGLFWPDRSCYPFRFTVPLGGKLSLDSGQQHRRHWIVTTALVSLLTPP
jgi:hypothetical protein